MKTSSILLYKEIGKDLGVQLNLIFNTNYPYDIHFTVDIYEDWNPENPTKELETSQTFKVFSEALELYQELTKPNQEEKDVQTKEE